MATDNNKPGSHPDDQDLIALQMGGSHRGSPVEKVLIIIIVVIAAGIAGWYFLGRSTGEAPANAEAAVAAVSHYEMLEAWKVDKLAGTEFADLELALWNGQYCLKYKATDATSIDAVMKRYVAAFCASPEECDTLTERYTADSSKAFRQNHQDRTTVTAGDEILLPIPGEVVHPELATPSS